MNDEKLLKVLLAPLVTEKTSLGGSEDAPQYAFKIASFATKKDVKQAVESFFKVAVVKVTVARVKGKVTQVGRRLGRHKDWKKAYVTLAKGAEIDVASI